jgi:glycosyltransferase involved in cell wall biosynthesis
MLRSGARRGAWCEPADGVVHDTLILIPAYNEAQRIGTVIQSVTRAQPEAAILVVDDGSSDDTAARARAAGARVISHAMNLGYGCALQTGYRYAHRTGVARLVQLDADGQHEADSIDVLLAGLDGGLDLCVGSRYLAGDPPKTSFSRRVGSRLFAWITTLWTGVKITDPTSGFQAMNASALQRVVGDSFPEDYPDADVLISLARAGLRIGEAPVRMYPRQGGVSMHSGGRAAFYAYKMMLTLTLLPVRRESPFRSGRSRAG